MYRAIAFVVVALALATFTVDVGAQKKDTKDAGKSGVGTIEVYKAKKGWRYRIKDDEAKTIAMPLPQMHWELMKFWPTSPLTELSMMPIGTLRCWCSATAK